jgi:hypothetical protein
MLDSGSRRNRDSSTTSTYFSGSSQIFRGYVVGFVARIADAGIYLFVRNLRHGAAFLQHIQLA